MRKGSIVLIPFPFTDLTGQKIRPAVVLHAGKGEDCIVAFITSHAISTKTTHTVSVKPTERNGLKAISQVRVDKLATLQKQLILGEIGALEEGDIKKADALLMKLFGL